MRVIGSARRLCSAQCNAVTRLQLESVERADRLDFMGQMRGPAGNVPVMPSEPHTQSGSTDILVIGAGLAGLRCASVLADHGRDVRVWEAASEVGGRVRTDIVEGFHCDHGFQVLNPAYPELRRAFDLPALRLQPFGPGVAVRRTEGFSVWVHPLRTPTGVPAMLAGGGVRARDLVAVTRWAAPALRPKALTRPNSADTALYEALDRARVGGDVRRVIDRFLAGVVLEDTGATSNAFALLLIRMFILGVPALPAAGMKALPHQMAARLQGRISLRRDVTRLEPDGAGWLVGAGTDVMRAQHVVIATDPVRASALSGLPAPSMHGVVTDWWATDRRPDGPAMLWVDGRPGHRGPVLNAAVISAAAPTYAPPGRHLIAASALVSPQGDPPAEADTREHAADILRADAEDWVLLRRHVIGHALPAQPPPLRVRQTIRARRGLWVCGDHRDTASIQGALASGRRTAAALLGRGADRA